MEGAFGSTFRSSSALSDNPRTGRPSRSACDVLLGHVVVVCQVNGHGCFLSPAGRRPFSARRRTASVPVIPLADPRDVAERLALYPWRPFVGPDFVGRTSERELLDGLLAKVQRRRERGPGHPRRGRHRQDRVLRYAARQASGYRVAELSGVEAEMELAFAGIHQLCGTMLDRFDALPAPQHDALSIALRFAAGKVPDRFLVGLAVLSLLAAVAEERPLLCLHRGRAVAGCRLKPDRRPRRSTGACGVCWPLWSPCASPHTAPDFDGLSELRLEGLHEPEARSLLRGVITRPARQPSRQPDCR